MDHLSSRVLLAGLFATSSLPLYAALPSAPGYIDDSGYSAAAKTRILPAMFEQKLTSTKYIAKADNPLITLAESTGFKQTSDYHQTRAWLQKLADASGGAIALSDLPENSATGEPMLL